LGFGAGAGVCANATPVPTSASAAHAAIIFKRIDFSWEDKLMFFNVPQMCHKTRAAGMSIFDAKSAHTAPQVGLILVNARILVRARRRLLDFTLFVPSALRFNVLVNSVNHLQLRIVLICVKKQFL
jgi:hypothetical protein